MATWLSKYKPDMSDEDYWYWRAGAPEGFNINELAGTQYDRPAETNPYVAKTPNPTNFDPSSYWISQYKPDMSYEDYQTWLASAPEGFDKSLLTGTEYEIFPETKTPAPTSNVYEKPNMSYQAQSFGDIYESIMKSTGGAGDYTTPDTLMKQFQSGEYTVMNPYTRGLMEYNLMEGETPYNLTPEGIAALQQERVDLLTKSVTEPAGANLKLALTEVEKQMQKAGKYASSATTSAMMRTGEAYGADIAGKIAAGTLSIYEQVGVEIGNELNRVFQSGLSQNETEASLLKAGLDAETSRRIAELNSQTQKQVSILNSATSQRIAEIQADTTMSGYEKDMAVAQLQADTQKQVAQINADAQVQAAQEAGTGSTQMELNFQEKLKINTDTGLPYDVEFARENLLENSRQFDILNINPKTGKYRWMDEIDLDWANLIDPDTGRPYTYELGMQQLTEAIRQFDFTNLDENGEPMQWKEFEQMVTEANRRFELDVDLKDLAEAQFLQKAMEFNLTRADQVNQFAKSLLWAKEQFGLTDTQVRDLQAAQLLNNLDTIDKSYGYLNDTDGVPYTYTASIAAIANSKYISDNQMVPVLDENGNPVLDSEGNPVEYPAEYMAVLKNLEQNKTIFEAGIDEDSGLTYAALMIKASMMKTEDGELMTRQDYLASEELKNAYYTDTEGNKMPWSAHLADKELDQRTITVNEEGDYDPSGTKSITFEQYKYNKSLMPVVMLDGTVIKMPEEVAVGFEAIKIESKNATTAERKESANFILTVLNYPPIVKYMEGKGIKVLGTLIEVVTGMATVGFDATDEEWEAAIDNAIDKLGDDVDNVTKNELRSLAHGVGQIRRGGK